MGWFGRGKSERKDERLPPPARHDASSDQTQVLTGDDRIDAQKVRILLDTIAELISTVEHRDVLTKIVDNAIHVVGAERGILFLFENGDSTKLRIRVARAAGGRDLEVPIQYSTTVTGKVAESGEPMTWKVSSQDTPLDLSQSIVDMKLTSVMCTTLRVKDQRLGVIYVDSRATHREFTRADLRFFDALAGALSVTVENARLIREILANERVKEQVKIARQIQEGLLPRTPEGIDGFQIAGWSEPAEEALGDYYDFIPLEDGRLVFAIGDVAGHGIGPALLMSSARSLLHSLTDGPFEIGDILERMNNRFEEDTSGAIFMSLFVGLLDPKQRTFTYGNAGHTAPVVIRGATDASEDLGQTGLALGIESGMPYRVEGPVRLDPNDIVVLTTDGILEARRGDEFYGRDRLKQAVRNNRTLTPRELIRAVHRSVLDFTRGAAPDDDLTMVVLCAK